MTLSVEPPAPPELEPADKTTDDGGEEMDYRRGELSDHLRAGAWADAFEEWAERTDLTDEQFAIVEDLGLIDQFDFFWDEFAQRVGYHAPGLPEDWRERNVHPELDSWNTVSGINAGMAQLGGIVSERLENDYVDWEPGSDLPDDLPEFD